MDKTIRWALMTVTRCDAELVAHTEFRKQLHPYDVVPHARAAAAALLP